MTATARPSGNCFRTPAGDAGKPIICVSIPPAVRSKRWFPPLRNMRTAGLPHVKNRYSRNIVKRIFYGTFMEFIHTDRPLSWFRRNRYAAFSDNDQPPIRQRRAAKQLGFAFHDRSSIDRLAHESGLSAAYISNWQTECPSLTVWGADDSRAFVQHPAQAPYYTDERKMFLIQSGIKSFPFILG